MITQGTLWTESPARVDSLIGKTIRYKNGRTMQVTGILAHTKQYGTMYQLQDETTSYPYCAYKDDFKEIA